MAPLHEYFKLSPQALCRAYLSSAQDDLAQDDNHLVTLDGESFDPGSYFNTTTYKFVAPIAGFYAVAGQVGFKNIVADKIYKARLKVEGTTTLFGIAHSGLNAYITPSFADIIQLAASDEVTLNAVHESGVDTVDLINDPDYTYLSIHLLSAS